jgi:hypothetical protein
MKKGKRAIALILLATSLFSAGCTPKEGEEITADELITAYENAGYVVRHRDHREDLDAGYYSIEATLGEGEDGEFIYFHVYDTKEEAEQATEEGQWNIVLWIFSLPFGEYRWLKSKTYNNIHYEYFDRDMTKPFKELMD